MRHLAAACLLLLATAPAWAQSRPTSVPTRDVTVTYQSPNGHDVTIEFSASARRMRIVGMGAQGDYAIIERDGNDMFIVMPARQMVMRMPESPQLHATLSMRAFSGFRRMGSATVAGVSCRLWDVQGQHGESEICVTRDGVLLRARRAGAATPNDGMLQAVKVVYHSLPPSDFEVPVGYRAMTLPQGMPGGMPPGVMPPGAMPPGAKPKP